MIPNAEEARKKANEIALKGAESAINRAIEKGLTSTTVDVSYISAETKAELESKKFTLKLEKSALLGGDDWYVISW